MFSQLRSFEGSETNNITIDAYNENKDMICQAYPRLHRLVYGSGHNHGDDKSFTYRVIFDPPMTYPDNDNGTFRGELATLQDPVFVLGRRN